MSANQYGRAIAALGEALSWMSESDSTLSCVNTEIQDAQVIKELIEQATHRNGKAFRLIRKALKHIAEA